MNNPQFFSSSTRPITPQEINEAVIIFHEILLKKDLYPRDQDLLMAARMTPPIIDMAISLHSLMDVNRFCFMRYFRRSQVDDEDGSPNFPNQSTEFFLHRCDMSTHVEEHCLFIDFGNREGSICEEVTNLSHRFDEYKEFISNTRDGFDALQEATDQMQFKTREERDFAAAYTQCSEDMENILIQLVDAFQLNFMDPRKLIQSAIGQRILNEVGSRVLKVKLERLQEYLDSEFQLTGPPR